MNGDEIWLLVTGRIDAVESPNLAAELEMQLASEPPHMIVDLGAVDYLDSSGLAVLVRAWRTCEAAGRRFSLVMPVDRSAQRIFDLAGFDSVFDVISHSNPA